MTQDTETEDVLIEIAPSASRRWIGILALAGLGMLLLRGVFDQEGGLSRLVLLGLAILAFLAADRLRQGTADSIILTKTELRTGSGRRLAQVDNVKAVERGLLAFKPSNGFLVRLHEPEGRGWAPGLWWQRGRMIGVGGVLPNGSSRAMADMLAVLIAGPLPDFD